MVFEDIWKCLNDSDESVEIEAKTAQQIGSSIQETISAFSNEPNRKGGYLLLGIRRTERSLFGEHQYEIVGVADPDKIQADFANLCRTAFNIAVRPQLSVHTTKNGKNVVVAYVPEAQPHEKPVFILARGLPKGAFRRIGSTDQHCTDDDVQLLYQGRKHNSFDETTLSECAIEDLDPSAIAEYRRNRAESTPTSPELAYNDEDLLLSLFAASRENGRVVPTIAGLLLFGKRQALRRHFPILRIDYIRVPGREWVRDPDRRFDTVEVLDPLMLSIPRVINTILDDIPTAFTLPAGSNRRKDVPLIPRTAIREAVVNAVMHRSYRQKSAVQIIRYANRLEIRNPGHSLVPDERLGEPGSVTRNEKIAAVLHETRYAETKGSGIRAMREAMNKQNLSPPTFESDREKDTFVVTFLFHHFLNPDDIQWLGHFSDLELTEDEQKALVFAREIGAINNAAYRDINRVETLVASGHLRKLRDHGLFEQKGRGSQTFYAPTERMLNPQKFKITTATSAPGQNPVPSEPTRLSPQDKAQPLGLGPNLGGLPKSLAEAIISLGQRAAPDDLRAVVRQLCQWKPLTSEQLAGYLGRHQVYLTQTHLAPMIRDGELVYLYPDRPAHPQQAYTVPTKRGRK
ncbi:MAG TPA: ATP-binding protein [Tepidisphaeraceae bacterium]|jgi:ATP-dependent DNA helicase RecG